MLHYHDGRDVRVGDSIRHAGAPAVVETIIEGEEVARWCLEASGFMIICDECGRVLIEPHSYDWEDVSFVERDAESRGMTHGDPA